MPNTINSAISYGMIGSTAAGYGYTTMTITANQPYMTISGMDKNEIRYTFHELENGQLVNAELSPDSGIGTREALDIQLLITALGTSLSSGFKPITYIRSKNLERHFRFKV